MSSFQTSGGATAIEFAERQMPIFLHTVQRNPPATGPEDFAKTETTRRRHEILPYVDRNIKARPMEAVKC